MSRYLSLTIARMNAPKFRLRREAIDLDWLNSRKFKAIMIGLIIFGGLFYIIQINILSTKGFAIKELEIKISQLKAENQALELKAAEIQSSSKLQSRIEGLNMVAVAKIDYISPTAEMVARAK